MSDEKPARMAEDVPLSSLYLQIEYADSPFAVLGTSNQPTEIDLRERYRTLALRIHPDKAPNDSLRELHTSLFQKVEAAFREILQAQFEPFDDGRIAQPKRLPETLASLHARNVAFQDALRNERERALKSKHAADAREAAKQAQLKAKNDRLAHIREARAQTLELARARKEKAAEKRSKETTKRLKKTAEREGNGAHDQPPLDWEQEEDRLEAEAEHEQPAVVEVAKEPIAKRVVQNTPTANTARPMWDDAIDERLVSDAEIKGRWDKTILAGGRLGSVSLSQKKQREHSGAARTHKYVMALCEEADHMVKPALTGNRTFSTLEEEEMTEAAFVDAEIKAERRTDRMLQLMDEDVKEQYLLNDGGQRRAMALEYLMGGVQRVDEDSQP